MKKYYIIILVMLSLIACHHKRNIHNLKPFTDKMEDVKDKWGWADSTASTQFFDLPSEAWFYKKDSVALIFTDEILFLIVKPFPSHSIYDFDKDFRIKMDSCIQYSKTKKTLEGSSM